MSLMNFLYLLVYFYWFYHAGWKTLDPVDQSHHKPSLVGIRGVWKNELRLKEMVLSIVHHIANNHSDFYGHTLFKLFSHPPITRWGTFYFFKLWHTSGINTLLLIHQSLSECLTNTIDVHCQVTKLDSRLK